MKRKRFPAMEEMATSRAIEAVTDALGECIAISIPGLPRKGGRVVLPEGIQGRLDMLKSLALEVRDLEEKDGK